MGRKRRSPMRVVHKTIALTLAYLGLAGLSLQCSKTNENEEAGAKGETDAAAEDDEDPFAKHEDTFKKFSDMKIVPKVTLPAASGGSGGETGKVSGTFESDVGLSAAYVLHVPDKATDGPLKL